MSRTLHIAKTYKVEWEGTLLFNRREYEFSNLLAALDIFPNYMFNDDYLDFEITKEDWKKAIATLSEPNVYPSVQHALDELECTREEVLEVFKQCLDKAEPDDTWMHFSFF